MHFHLFVSLYIHSLFFYFVCVSTSCLSRRVGVGGVRRPWASSIYRTDKHVVGYWARCFQSGRSPPPPPPPTSLIHTALCLDFLTTFFCIIASSAAASLLCPSSFPHCLFIYLFTAARLLRLSPNIPSLYTVGGHK